MIELPRRSRPDIHADINIVPYIDVMLVLLVIFMMTTPIIQQGMEVNLPQGPAEPMDLTGSSDQPIVISVDKNNNFYLSSVNDAGLKDVDESEAVDLKILINQVFAYYKEYPNSKIVMQADREANWGEIYKVMMYLENNGVPNVIFSSEDPNK
jgi:biopolymer transport protein TolR